MRDTFYREDKVVKILVGVAGVGKSTYAKRMEPKLMEKILGSPLIKFEKLWGFYGILKLL